MNATKICPTPKTEAKLTSILDTFSEKLESNISNLVPKLIQETLPDRNENVKEAVSKSLPSNSDIVSGNMKGNHSPQLQFVITGVPETETTYSKQIDKDTSEVENIVQHMHLQSENNITAIRRLGRVLKANVDETGQESHARCPLLVTTSKSRFLNSCFARSHYLQNSPTPVYVKKILSQDDRRLEKELLAKRYEMVTTEGKDRKDLKIKNLKLYYKKELVEISTY